MNSRLVLGLVALLVAGVVRAIIFQPPMWIVLPLGFVLLAAIFIAVRRNTDYEALDPYISQPQPHDETAGRTVSRHAGARAFKQLRWKEKLVAGARFELATFRL